MTDKNCKLCYGKGSYSRAFQETGSPDFPGDKGFKRMKIENVPCRCNRPDRFEDRRGRKPQAAEGLTREALRKAKRPDGGDIDVVANLERQKWMEEGARLFGEYLAQNKWSIFDYRDRQHIRSCIKGRNYGFPAPDTPAFVRKSVDL